VSIIIFLGSITFPLAMTYLRNRWHKFGYAFNVASLVAALIFGNITAFSVYKIISDHTVFMTKIHAVFLNPLFLASGAYLGVFFLYRLSLLTMESYEESKYRS